MHEGKNIDTPNQMGADAPKSSENKEEIKYSKYFEESFSNFKKWMEERKKEGLNGGSLIMKKWGSGDASTTLHLSYKNGGGSKSLNDFQPEGFDWYVVGKIHSAGIADEVKEILSQNNIAIEME